MLVSRRTIFAALISGIVFAPVSGILTPAAAKTVDVRGLGAVAIEDLEVRIVSVDLPSRTIVVERRGHQWRIAVPEDAGSLAALRPRDKLQINRVESALASVGPAKKGAKPDVSFTTARDDGLFGNLPARWIVRNVTATVKFTSFDKATGTVSYVGPEGSKSARAVDPVILQALQTLKKGDMVTLSFTQATEFVLTPRRF